ncbi:site-specific DNA-methyltransferase [Sphingomonas sp. RS2018]
MVVSNFPKSGYSWVAPNTLTPPNRKVRRFTEKKKKKLRASFAEFGWVNPLIVDESNRVMCGVGRLMVALEDGHDLVPIVRVVHMTEVQKRAYIIADNRIAEEGGWDKDMLRTELSGLVELGYDVELTGFDTLEIDTMLSIGEPEPPEDNVHLPTDMVTPVSRLNDRWHIGAHRVLCGDARDAACYERLLDGDRAHLIFTDPPYNCAIAGNVSGLGKVKHDNFVMGVGEQSMPEFAHTLLRPVFRCIVANAMPGAIAFVCIDWRAAPYLHDAAQGVFHEQKNLIIFNKTNAGMGTFYRSAHELIFAYKVSPGTHINNFGLGEGGRHRSNVWTYAGANTFRAGRMQDLADHSTVKPKKLVADAILDCSKRGGIVLDPFLGSGTTLVACEMTGRVGRGMELDPKYVDVILRRVSEETGCEPMLDGVTPFSVVKAQRESEES